MKHIPEAILESKKKSDQDEKKVFSIYGVNLRDMPMIEGGVPEVVAVLISYFERNPDTMRQKGLFRVSGAISEIENMEKALCNFEYEYIYEHPDHNVIGGMF